MVKRVSVHKNIVHPQFPNANIVPDLKKCSIKINWKPLKGTDFQMSCKNVFGPQNL
jgi:hypothetical protein